jgi:hypothetical protein
MRHGVSVGRHERSSGVPGRVSGRADKVGDRRVRSTDVKESAATVIDDWIRSEDDFDGSCTRWACGSAQLARATHPEPESLALGQQTSPYAGQIGLKFAIQV